MAKVQTNAAIGAIKGKAGGITFYIRNGQQEMMASSRGHYNDKRSASQMTARIKTGNVLNTYRLVKDFLDDCFEGVVGGKTKNSFFRKFNYILSPVMLEKSQNAEHKCVLAPYVVSNGILPSVGYEFKDGMFVSDIYIGTQEITDDTEIGTLASVVAKDNVYWSQGDGVKIILMAQTMYDDIKKFGCPVSSAVVLELKRYSRTRLGNIQPLQTGTGVGEIKLCNAGGYLAVKAEGEQVFACAFIHFRGAGQSVSVSHQALCLSNTVLYDYYTGEEAAADSLTSYNTQGYRKNPKDDVYLSPEDK